MYRINLDIINKILCIEISGNLSMDETTSYMGEMQDLINKFEPRQYSMLVMVHRLNPISQDNLPILQKVIELCLGWSVKIAVVSGNRTLTTIQLKRIEAEARSSTKSDTPIVRFKVAKEAMNYLNGFKEYT